MLGATATASAEAYYAAYEVCFWYVNPGWFLSIYCWFGGY